MIQANEEAISKLARISATKQLGDPGTAIHGGYIQENETDRSLIGTEKYKTYSNILANVSIVAAGVRQLLNLISNAEWVLEAADESSEAKRIVDELEMVRTGLKTPWARVVRKTATYKFYGFGVQVWTAKRMDNGVIGFARIDARPQSTIEKWVRDEWGDVEEIIQRSPQTYNELIIPRSRCIYIVDDALNDSPEGLGLFRHLAEPARRMQRIEQLEGYGLETDLRGIPIGRGPYTQLRKDENLTEDDRLAIELPLKSFIQGHIKTPGLGLILDSMTYQDDINGNPSNVRQWDLELLKAGSTSQPDAAKTIVRLTGDLARILHAEGLLLGSGPNGSEALSKDKSSTLGLMVESMLTEIAETMNQDFIMPHADMNGWSPKLMPKLKPSSMSLTSVEEITRSLHDMANAGAFVDNSDPAVNHVRKLLKVPPIEISSSGSDESLSLSGNRGKPNDMTIKDDDDTA